MGTSLYRFSVALHAVICWLGFGALFYASVSWQIKVFGVCGLLLIVSLLDILAVSIHSMFELSVESNEASFRVLEQRGAGDTTQSVEAALSSLVKRKRFDTIAGGEGMGHVIVIVGKYAVWLIGGWLVATYLFPALFKNVL